MSTHFFSLLPITFYLSCQTFKRVEKRPIEGPVHLRGRCPFYVLRQPLGWVPLTERPLGSDTSLPCREDRLAEGNLYPSVESRERGLLRDHATWAYLHTSFSFPFGHASTHTFLAIGFSRRNGTLFQRGYIPAGTNDVVFGYQQKRRPLLIAFLLSNLDSNQD